ncbi:MAG: hypothetical protein E7052_09535 [Lentisphaerae bacterium]|nr:hypothetical protein [Lentisphaerota bacterium]
MSYYVSSGVVSSGLHIYSNYMCIYSNGRAENTSVGYNGVLYISNGGVADNSVISNGGYIYISNGGTADRTTVNTSGSMYISSGGTGSSTTVNCYGLLTVGSGGAAYNTILSGKDDDGFWGGAAMYVDCSGSAEKTTVNSGGMLYISSGGTATAITENGGYVHVEEGASATFVPNTINGLVIGELSATLHSGTTAINTTVSYGSLAVCSGGVANYIIVSSRGSLVISSGGTATNITAMGDGYVYNACLDIVVASNTYIQGTYRGSGFEMKDAKLSGYRVGSANKLTVCSGAIATSSVVNSNGIMYVASGGMADNTLLGGRLEVYSGGIAKDTEIIFGTLLVRGSASNTSVGGGKFGVLQGGVADSTYVTSYGYMYISSGGTVTGILTVESGATVSAYAGSFVNFNVENRTVEDTYLISDLSKIYGNPYYSITVSADQAAGTYRLAAGAQNFSGAVSIGDDTVDYGFVSVNGSALEYNNSSYTLVLTDGALTLTVENHTPPEPDPDPASANNFFAGNFMGIGYDLLLKNNTSQADIYFMGNKWTELPLDDGWNIVGVEDFNGDGKSDILRKHTSGLVIGEISDGLGKFTPQVLNSVGSGWGIEGTGDFNGDGVGDVLIANPTAASETVGLLGYWKSGTEWTLINGYSPEWEMIATGDFNNDGKTDMLWRNEFVGAGDLTYNAYCTWIVDNANDWRMVSVANPDEWNFLCSGDFNADGCNDIAMINGDGVVGIWGVNDGYMNSWSILSAVTSEWKLAGVGDFNADGTDDIAWCNTESGLTGYWQITNKTLASWQNIATVA